MCGAQDKIVDGGANSFEITEAKSNRLSVRYSGLNSLLPCCSADGQATVDLNGGRTTVRLQGDDYPDFEAYQYTTSPAGRLLAHDDVSGAGGASHPWASDRDVTFIDGVRQ